MSQLSNAENITSDFYLQMHATKQIFSLIASIFGHICGCYENFRSSITDKEQAHFYIHMNLFIIISGTIMAIFIVQILFHII